MQLDLDKLIYLDLDFISRKFEEFTDEDPTTKTTKTEGGSAGIKAVFANAGVSVTESVTYSITSRSMLTRIWNMLNDKYEEFDAFSNYQGTKILWIHGRLTLAEWGRSGSNEPGYEFFQLNHSSERMAFLADQRYFSAGFSKALEASSALKGNISIPVRCLARVMWHVDDARNYVACPYVVIEEG